VLFRVRLIFESRRISVRQKDISGAPRRNVLQAGRSSSGCSAMNDALLGMHRYAVYVDGNVVMIFKFFNLSQRHRKLNVF